MQSSDERILTTHVGSLSRPPDLLEQIRRRACGETRDDGAVDDRVRRAVHEVVERQGPSTTLDSRRTIGFTEMVAEALDRA